VTIACPFLKQAFIFYSSAKTMIAAVSPLSDVHFAICRVTLFW